MPKITWREYGSGKDAESAITDLVIFNSLKVDCYIRFDLPTNKWCYEAYSTLPSSKRMSSVYGQAETLDKAKKQAAKIIKCLNELE